MLASHKWRFCLPLMALCLLAACGNRLFYANFEADPVGAPPALFPPELPTSDSIEVIPSSFFSGILCDQAVLDPVVAIAVSDNDPIDGKQSLVILPQVDVGGFFCPNKIAGDRVRFNAKPIAGDYETLSILWIGRSTELTLIDFLVRNSDSLFNNLELRLEDDTFFHNDVPFAVVTPGVPHAVAIEITDQDAFNVQVYGGFTTFEDAGGKKITFQSAIGGTTGLLEDNGDTLPFQEISLTMRMAVGEQTTGTYHVDQVVMSRPE